MSDLVMVEIDPIEDKIREANTWVAIAEPIIREYLVLDDSLSRMNTLVINTRDRHYRDTPLSRTYGEAQRAIMDAMQALEGIASGVREDLICDVYVNTPMDATDEEEDRIEAMNKLVRAEIITYPAALATIIEKVNEEYIQSRLLARQGKY